MRAKEIIECNACHVCDGELYEGWRVGCDDLVFRSGAEEAVKIKEEEMKLKAIEAHWKCCPNLSKDNDRMCNHLTDCDRQCFYMNEFINQLY